MTAKQLPNTNLSIVILYTELADYLLSCLNELCNQSVNVHIVNYPINKEAPFQFTNVNSKIMFYNRADFNTNSLITLIENINPSLIYCAGWNDRDYLKTVKHFKSKIPALLGFDNQWKGSLKQYLSALYARVCITPNFKYAFVPGKLQQTFAIKLGFKTQNILAGAYSANTTHFETIYQSQKAQKQTHFPKRFLYVGRYYEFKGIKELWQAFIELQTEQPNEWELWCLGIGDIEPIKHPNIKHFGFVQPKDLPTYTLQTGVFILPSRFEPWGVVVHEFAASGFPLLLSNQVGAKEQFLKEGENGFEFKSENISDIKRALKSIISCSDVDLLDMSAYSNKLSKSISPTTWVNSLLKMAKPL